MKRNGDDVMDKFLAIKKVCKNQFRSQEMK